MKKFSTIETLRILLEHHDIISEIIRDMDQRNDVHISHDKLNQVVIEKAKRLPSDQRKRLISAIDIDNLMDTHLVADRDVFEGHSRLLLQDSVIGIFRLCDRSLFQELTDAMLKSQMVIIRDLSDRLSQATFIDHDDDYKELKDEVFRQLGLVSNLIKQNINRMEILGSELKDMSQNALTDPQNFMLHREAYFDQISRIFSRHIQPTQQFLNDKRRDPDGKNLFQCLDHIQSLFESNDKPELSISVMRYKIGFSSDYKPIDSVAKSVAIYLRKSRKTLAQFNAMENAFGRLKVAYEETLTHDLRNTRISQHYAKANNFVLGLKSQSRPKSLMYWDNIAYSQNILAEIRARLEDMKQLSSQKFEGLTSGKKDLLKERLEKSKQMKSLLDNMTIRPTKDLVWVLHNRLKDHLPNYQYEDLLSIEFMLRGRFEKQSKQALDSSKYQLRVYNNRHFINFDEFEYRYRPLVCLDHPVSEN